MVGYKISEKAALGIRKSICSITPFIFCLADRNPANDAATADPKSQIPGLVFVAANKNGEENCSHASGKRGVDTQEPMTLDSVFWIASCTKMIGVIACMQLAEQG